MCFVLNLQVHSNTKTKISRLWCMLIKKQTNKKHLYRMHQEIPPPTSPHPNTLWAKTSVPGLTGPLYHFYRGFSYWASGMSFVLLILSDPSVQTLLLLRTRRRGWEIQSFVIDLAILLLLGANWTERHLHPQEAPFWWSFPFGGRAP